MRLGREPWITYQKKVRNFFFKKKILLKIVSGKFVSNGLSVRGRQDLEIQGPRLNNTKEEKTSIKYGPDRRLDPIITEEMPLLEVCSYFLLVVLSK